MVRALAERCRRQGSGAADRDGHSRGTALHSHWPGLHFTRGRERIHFEPEAAGAVEGESPDAAWGIAWQSAGVDPLRVFEHAVADYTLRYDLSLWLSHREADVRERARHYDSIASLCSRWR